MKILFSLLMFLFAFTSFGQNQWELINGDWYIENYSIDDYELLTSDTLILHRKEWTDGKGDHEDSTFNTSNRWNIQFDDFGGLGISWCDFVRAARGGEPPYCSEMYPCQNSVWQMDRKTIVFYLEGIPYTFRVYRSKENDNQYVLIQSS